MFCEMWANGAWYKSVVFFSCQKALLIWGSSRRWKMSRISRFILLGLHTHGMWPSSSLLLPTEGIVDRLGRFSLLSPKAVLDTFSTQYLSQLPAANGTDETSWHSEMSYFTLLPSLPIRRIVFGSISDNPLTGSHAFQIHSLYMPRDFIRRCSPPHCLSHTNSGRDLIPNARSLVKWTIQHCKILYSH